MWNIFKQSSSRCVRRHGINRQIPRSGIESLERRECPAVVFGLEGGVLSITGDDRANVIEVSEPREGQVQVVGDGVRHTFRGVNQIVIDAKGGNDAIQMSMDTIYGTGVYKINAGAGNDQITIGDVVRRPGNGDDIFDGIGGVFHIDAGAGNDRITIDDGPVNGQRRYFPGMVSRISVTLGTGRDILHVALNNRHSVELDVLSADGGDVIEAGILLIVCQHPHHPSYVCGVSASFQLGGDENRIDFNTQGYDQVDLDFDLTGNSNSVVIGLLLPAVQKATIHDRPRKVNLDLDGVGNFVSVNSDGFDDVGLDLRSGDYSTIQVGLLLPAVQKIREAAARIDLNVGADSFVDVSLENFDNGDADVFRFRFSTDTGLSNTGGDTPSSLTFSARAGDAHSAPSMNATLKTGAADDKVSILARGAGNLNLAVDTGSGDDSLDIDIAGYTRVNVVLDAGAGNDSIRGKMFSVVDRTNVKVNRARFDFFAQLGEGSDTLLLETLGGREIRTVIDTGPEGDGRDRVSATHQSLRRSGPVQRHRLVQDGGMDIYEHLSIGYTVQFNMTSPTRQLTFIREL